MYTIRRKEVLTVEEKEKVFADYIENNCESIAKEVDREFENQKSEIRKEIVNEIAKYLDPVPPHYEWYDDGIPLTDYFDPVYELCQAFWFFFASEACKYVGIL